MLTKMPLTQHDTDLLAHTSSLTRTRPTTHMTSAQARRYTNYLSHTDTHSSICIKIFKIIFLSFSLPLSLFHTSTHPHTHIQTCTQTHVLSVHSWMRAHTSVQRPTTVPFATFCHTRATVRQTAIKLNTCMYMGEHYKSQLFCKCLSKPR